MSLNEGPYTLLQNDSFLTFTLQYFYLNPQSRSDTLVLKTGPCCIGILVPVIISATLLLAACDFALAYQICRK